KECARPRSPGSILSTCTLHWMLEPLLSPEDFIAAVWPASRPDNPTAIVTVAAIHTIQGFDLLVFMRYLRRTLPGCPVIARPGVHAPSHKLLPDKSSLSFPYLEDRAVNSSIIIYVFHGQGVVFLMTKETDDSATSERSSSLPDLRRCSPDLLALATQKHALNRRDLYVCGGL